MALSYRENDERVNAIRRIFFARCTGCHRCRSVHGLSFTSGSSAQASRTIVMISSGRYVSHPSIVRRLADSAVLLFVAYWALILPFVCWGSWAQVDHPHTRPHFVFALPRVSTDWARTAPATTIGNSATMLASVATLLLDSHCTAVVGAAHPAENGLGPATQSTPASLATLLLAFVVPLLALLLFLPLLVYRRLPLLQPTDCPLAVGTPPPRIVG